MKVISLLGNLKTAMVDTGSELGRGKEHCTNTIYSNSLDKLAKITMNISVQQRFGLCREVYCVFTFQNHFSIDNACFRARQDFSISTSQYMLILELCTLIGDDVRMLNFTWFQNSDHYSNGLRR